VSRPPVSRWAIVMTIISKDLRTFGRDRLWMLLTPLALIAFVTLFYAMPAEVDETLSLGVYPPALAVALAGAWVGGGDLGLRVVVFEEEAALAAAVASGVELAAGLSLVSASSAMSARLLVAPSLPDTVRASLVGWLREVAASAAGIPLPVNWSPLEIEVLGSDRAGDPIALRERMRPLMAFMVLLTESLALASLVAVEIRQRTASALLVSPVRAGEVLLAKGLVGTGLAFSQALILLVATRAFGVGWPALLLATLLGAALVSAVGMFTGAAGRDFLGTLFFGMGFLLLLAVPAVASLFPGGAQGWVSWFPSYGIVAAMEGATVYGLGLRALVVPLLQATAWTLLLLALAAWVLQRKLVRV
jgi:ABC-2 type transport system permease protein